jgi:hypothetical protein
MPTFDKMEEVIRLCTVHEGIEAAAKKASRAYGG